MSDGDHFKRVADALERIAATLEDQFEMTKVMQLDAGVVLKAAAELAKEDQEDCG